MNSLIVPGGEAPSHVRRHDWSLSKHVVATHTAIDRQAGSFGQLVALMQHWFCTQAAQDEPAALKSWATPGQLPASVTVVVIGGTPASRGGAFVPPPVVGPPQVATPMGVHFPCAGGLPSGVEGFEDEQARQAAMAPASDA
jgi:hypothetical protein